MHPLKTLSGYLLMFAITGVSFGQVEQIDFPILEGPYLGQNPPGLQAEMFAPGIISTGLHDDAGPAFNRSGTEIFFRIAGKPYGIIGNMKEIDGRWTKPDLAPFSGRYPDGFTVFSHDEKRIFFGSRRPAGGTGAPPETNDIWAADVTENGYGIPYKLGPPINTPEADEYLTSIAANGNLYFNKRVNIDGKMTFETYFSEYIDNKYSAPQKVDLPLDPNFMSFGGSVDPDEKYMIVFVRGKDNGFGSDDLYVSFHHDDGSWGELINLGSEVNSPLSDAWNCITPDGKYLFFVSWRYDGESYSETTPTYDEIIAKKKGHTYGWGADIYWVSTELIEKLK
ncbi:MAG: hypothetical protein GY780_01620 [bacterium]|nr:hypothetical protein [bacterium]